MSLIRKSVLDSGIKVITEGVPDMESSSIGVWVNIGSRNEAPHVGGVSHFIEHLLFKGTERRSALDISREIESVGGVLNAFTGREYTCFYAKVLNKDLPLAMDLLSDMLLNSRFAPEDIEKERMVVLQEIKMVEDTPDDLIHDLFAERFWPGHPIGRSILGTHETIGSIGRRELLGYFRRNYTPANTFITAAGGLSHSKVVRLLRKTFGKIKPGPSAPPVSVPSPARGAKLIRKDLEQVHVCLGVPVPGQSHPDRYKVYLMNTILGGGMSSRLFQEIREKRGLAYSVYSYLNLMKDAGSFVVYAGISGEKFHETVRLILKEFSRFRKGVSREELRCAKEQLKGGMLLGLETSDSRMMKLARDEVYFGRVVPIRSIVRGIDSVTVRDMKRLAEEALDPGKAALVAMGKVSKKGLPSVFSRP